MASVTRVPLSTIPSDVTVASSGRVTNAEPVATASGIASGRSPVPARPLASHQATASMRNAPMTTLDPESRTAYAL